MKLFKKVLFEFLVVLLALSLIGCGKTDDDNPVDDKYNVTFKVIDENKNFVDYGEVVKVTPNRRLTKPTDPILPSGYIFTSWYENSDLSGDAWEFETSIVTKNTILYAGYRELSNYPTDLKEEEAPCSSNLYWTQESIGSGYTITLIDGLGIETVLDGSFTFDNDTHYVSFIPATLPIGGYYNVKVVDNMYPDSPITLENVLFSGDGSKNNPYLLGNALDFTLVNQKNVSQNTYFKMIENITIETDREKQKEFTFNGELDGNHKTLNLENSNSGAIYKVLEKGYIHDLIVTGSVSTTSNDSVGGLVDYNDGLIDEVSVTLTVTSTTGTVGLNGLADVLSDTTVAGKRGIAGGIVGTNLEHGVISNSKITSTSSSTGVVKANIGGGCIVGLNKGEVTLCISEGCLGAYNSTESGGKSLSNYSFGGGIVGINLGKVNKCSLEGAGKVLAQRYTEAPDAVYEGTTNSYLGGIAGYNASGAVIDTCSYSGIRVHGDENIGGIVGANKGTVKNSISEGVYHDTPKVLSYIGGRQNIGGIVGLDEGGLVINCIVTANVYAYTENKGYSVALNASNCIYINNNLNNNSLTTNPNAVNLVAPIGENNIIVEVVKGSYDELATNYLLNESYLSKLNDAFMFDGTTIKLNITFEEEDSISVKLMNGNNLFKSVLVYETGSAINGPTVSGFIFKGWATTEDGNVVFEAGTIIGLYDLTNYIIEGTVTLYAKFEERVVSSKLTISVWNKNYTWITENELEAIKTGFALYLKQKNITTEIDWVIETATVVADLGASVNTRGNVDIVIGSGTNIATTGGVQIITRDAILTSFVAAGRQAALITDTIYAKALYSYLTGIEDTEAEVTIYGDNDLTEVTKVDNILKIEAIKPIITIPDTYVFIGWSKEKDAKTPLIEAGSMDTAITYASVKDYLTDGKIALYPVYEIPEKDKLVVSVWNKNFTWVTQEEITSIKNGFNTYLTQNAVNLNNLEITWIIETLTGVADLGNSVINAGNVDIIVGNGANVTTTGKVETFARNSIQTSIVAAEREVSLLNEENAYAVYLFKYLTGITEDEIEVTIVGDTTSVSKVNSLYGTFAILPVITVGENSKFIGYALTENQTQAIISLTAVDSKINYNSVSSFAIDGKVTLYPVFEVIVVTPLNTTMVVSVWNNEYTWITDAELQAIKTGFNSYLTSKKIDITNIVITWRIETETKVANLGNSVNTAKDVDIIIGCGANVNTTGGVTIISKDAILTSYIAAARQTAILTENTLANNLYSYLTVAPTE